jgi:uncharacterized SAM-binding protein YcdF (DUF218 family)
LKKIISLTLYPLSICLTALIVGLFFIWFTRKQKLGKIFVTAGVVVLTFVSFGPVTDTLLSSLENKYPPLTDLKGLEDIKWIVVLGGGHNSDSRYPANDQLSGASLSRLIEGIRIHNFWKDSKLILSGGAVFDPVAEARVMSEVALTLGEDPDDMLLELESKDTEDQARLIPRVANFNAKERFILVTNAAHMPRAVALFRKYGTQPIPAPTDFWVKDAKGVNPISFFPTASSLQKMERVFHEYLGLAWAKMKPKNK